MANDESTQKAAHKSKRARSPGYPSDDLETCVNWARSIYEAEQRSSIPQVIAASRMGFSALSGPARTGISAMRKFGLLADDGSNVKLSEDAIKILRTPDERERADLLRTAGRRPKAISDVLSAHPHALPSEETLRYQLVRDSFFSEDGARTFVAVLKKTVEFAKLYDGQYDDGTMPTAEEVALPVESSTVSMRGSAAGTSFASARSSATTTLQVPVSGGIKVEILASGPLEAETLEELLEYLAVYKKVLSKTKPTS